MPHSDRPFIVGTANTVVRVLGTTFSVRQYPRETVSRIMVVDGRVALTRVSAPEAGASRASATRVSATRVLTARMSAVVSDSGMMVATQVPTSDALAWTQGRLVFRSAPLSEVVTELARAYGMNIRLVDTTLATQPVTMAASIDRDPLSSVLDFLTLVMDAHYTCSGRECVISRGRAVKSAPRSRNILQQEFHYGR
jgi:ferric-dicitrate binding protein FerR (iron transport regulator)